MHSWLLIAEYAFLIHVPLLLAAFLVVLPPVAFFTPAKSLLKGLFDLTPLGLAAVTLASVAVAGTACMNAPVVLFHAYQRFDLVSPPHRWWWLIIMLWIRGS